MARCQPARDARRVALCHHRRRGGTELESKVDTLAPGKKADMLDATRIHLARLNQVPGAVVSLMDRINVETVIVAGRVRKWKGQLLDNSTGFPIDLRGLRAQLEGSRDYLFSQYINNPFVGNPVTGNPPITHGVPKDLFRGN
jgi:5-methylthioadenosine/S-adenosylhomocysteine deaminase